MNGFPQFAAAHGLRIDHLEEGRWVRVKTEDKPSKKNGAYKFLGDIGFVQNHATMVDVAIWRNEESETVDREAFARRMRELRAADRKVEAERHAKASKEASALIAKCVSRPHAYLAKKGFPNAVGLVNWAGDLIIPMRDLADYGVVNSLQRIREDGSKAFLPGGKAKGSVFVLGKGAWQERWLVEGYATGLSVYAALSDLRRPAEVVICFSAGNLRHVAAQVKRPAFVMADNDASGTGQEAAGATGLPWGMPEAPGTDANDLHASKGLRALVGLVGGIR